jgi:hypothetical protein
MMCFRVPDNITGPFPFGLFTILAKTLGRDARGRDEEKNCADGSDTSSRMIGHLRRTPLGLHGHASPRSVALALDGVAGRAENHFEGPPLLVPASRGSLNAALIPASGRKSPKPTGGNSERASRPSASCTSSARGTSSNQLNEGVRA